MRYLSAIALGLPLLASAYAQAQTFEELVADYRRVSAAGETTHLLDIDNDTLLLNRNDGFYSSGLRYTQQHTARGPTGATTYGWRLGQKIYTASDIKLRPALVRPPDHPYAGWLYGGFFRENGYADGTYTRFGIDIGCIGPCAGGEWTQTSFHRVLNQPLPKGWDRQVKNELGVILHAEIAPVRWKPTRTVDITPRLKLRFGNVFTDAGAGIAVRAGKLHASPTESSFHGFLRADIQLVGHNAALQGGYFSEDNPHTVEPKDVVGEAEIGVVWREGQYGVAASLIRRGNEIRALPNSIGAQNYVHLRFFYTP